MFTSIPNAFRCAAFSSFGTLTHCLRNSYIKPCNNAFLKACNRSISKRSVSMASVRNEAEGKETRSSRITTETCGQRNQQNKIRENWKSQIEDFRILRDTQPYASRLEFLIDSFRKSLLSLPLSPNTGDEAKTRFCIITAWLLSDNVIIDLFSRVSRDNPELQGRLSSIIAIDTLHLFPETFQTAEMMRRKYPEIMRGVDWIKPRNCNTREDFHELYGQFYDLPESEFDYWTKVEPLQQALKSSHEKSPSLIIVTGRRSDQGRQRISVPLWEEDKFTFNPLLNWTWNDVTLYCQHYDVPVNPLHQRLYIDPFHRFIGKKERDSYKDFLEVTLDYPYFYYKDSILRQSFTDANSPMNFYVWKSLGDVVTSVPVSSDESERDGRFVHRQASECGIHTRVCNTRKAPHGGGVLVNLLEGDQKSECRNSGPVLTPGVDYDHVMELNERQVCDLELLMNGGFSPLKGFMSRLDYEPCVNEMRLAEGSLWGLPVVLDSDDTHIQEGQRLLLRSLQMGGDLAVMTVEDVWKPDKMKEALKVLNTAALDHPYVHYMMNTMGSIYIGGPITRGVRLPTRFWLPSTPTRVATPQELRRRYSKSPEVLAFQCRNPLHRAHVEMFTQGINNDGLQVVVHPSIGPSKQDDFDARIRVPTYEILNQTLQQRGIDVYYIPYHMRLAGPRETIQHLICRKNYGFTRMIIGRDHAGCKDAKGNDFYGPYEAQDMAQKYSAELGIASLPFEQLVYVPKLNVYMEKGKAQSQSLETKSISGTEFRRRINQGLVIPEWYAFPEVVRLLEASFRFHLTDDVDLPQRIASTIKQTVVAVSIARSSLLFQAHTPCLDAQLSKQIISVSERFPSIPFFVVSTDRQESNATNPNVESLQVITPSGFKSTSTLVVNSFAELETQLKKLDKNDESNIDRRINL